MLSKSMVSSTVASSFFCGYSITSQAYTYFCNDFLYTVRTRQFLFSLLLCFSPAKLYFTAQRRRLFYKLFFDGIAHWHHLLSTPHLHLSPVLLHRHEVQLQLQALRQSTFNTPSHHHSTDASTSFAPICSLNSFTNPVWNCARSTVTGAPTEATCRTLKNTVPFMSHHPAGTTRTATSGFHTTVSPAFTGATTPRARLPLR